MNGAPFALRFSLATNQSNLRFKVLLPPLHEANAGYRVRLHGAEESDWGHGVNIGASGDWQQNGDGQAALIVEDNSYELQILLSTSAESPLSLLSVMKCDCRIADFYA